MTDHARQRAAVDAGEAVVWLRAGLAAFGEHLPRIEAAIAALRAHGVYRTHVGDEVRLLAQRLADLADELDAPR